LAVDISDTGRPDLSVSEFDFHLPEELIALRPARPRSASKLLLAKGDAIEHHAVSDLPELLMPGDVLVFNDTRVLPVQLSGTRTRDGATAQLSATLIERIDPARWRAFIKPGKKLREGDTIVFADGFVAEALRKHDDGSVLLAFSKSGEALDSALRACGAMPLPPYIAGRRVADHQDEEDYQTLLATKDGAVAAPTAALHFDAPLLAALTEKGIAREIVTLHVGAGTFLPVKAETISEHKMHSEWGEIDAATAQRLNRAKAEGRRIISVGTTSLRVLETASDETGNVSEWRGNTDIFITEGYRFRFIDGLMTNFHLPKSTLFMLVSALMGHERMKEIYSTAIERHYRFYSYGDSSLLLPR